ncbi:MAG: hypothetical protein ABIO02_02455 [Patescibacteria group bacterium]
MKNPILLAQDPPQGVREFIGTINPPSGIPNYNNPQELISNLLGTGIKMFIIVASLVLLMFLLWGALDWILSGGEKEKLHKAQSKITNAIIGFVLIFVMLALFGLITGDILGIVVRTDDGGWFINLPSLGGNTSQPPVDPPHHQ